MGRAEAVVSEDPTTVADRDSFESENDSDFAQESDNTPYIFRLGEPREPVQEVSIEVSYGPQTIIAVSRETGKKARLRRRDRYIGALMYGMTQAYVDQGVDPLITAPMLATASRGRISYKHAERAIEKFKAVGAVESVRANGYRIVQEPKVFSQLLTSSRNVNIPKAKPDLWEERGVISERYRDFIADTLEYIGANKGFTPSRELRLVDPQELFSELRAKTILFNLASRKNNPLFTSSLDSHAPRYRIADRAVARRILAGLQKQYLISVGVAKQAPDWDKESPNEPEPIMVTLFGGTIEFISLDGTKKLLPSDRIEQLMQLAIHTDDHLRRFKTPDIHLEDLLRGTDFTARQMTEAMQMAQEIGLVKSHGRRGYRLTIPLEDFYAMLAGRADTVPYPDESLNEGVGFNEDQLQVITAIAPHIFEDGQLILREHREAVASQLGIQPSWLRRMLDEDHINGEEDPLLVKIDYGVYETADGNNDRLRTIVDAYSAAPNEFVIMPGESPLTVKRVEFGFPPRETLITLVHQSLIAHVRDRKALAILGSRKRFSELYSQLPPDHQRHLWYRVGRHLSPARVAELTGITYGAAKAHQHRALNALERLARVKLNLTRLDTINETRPKGRKNRRMAVIPEFNKRNRANVDKLIDRVAVEDRRYGAYVVRNRQYFVIGLRNLNVDQQRYLYLRFVEGKSVEEIQDYFGWGTKTAHYVKYQRIRRHFLADLAKRRRSKRQASERTNDVVVFNHPKLQEGST